MNMENRVNAALRDIVKHNQMQLYKAEGDQSHAKDLFTIEHHGTDIYDFFVDETLMNDVEPIGYYPPSKLLDVCYRWVERKHGKHGN